MAFETVSYDYSAARRPSVAIVGAGISGLGAAWRLAKSCNVTVFEADSLPGGHARTVMAGPNGDTPVDTGFMVFNDRTYPNLIALFDELGVPAIHAPMSFAVSMDEGRFEYGLTNLSRMFADRRNLGSPRFFRLLADIVKFNRSAVRAAQSPDITLGELIATLGLGADFSARYLFPLAGAIWSTARNDMKAFPARSLLSFFENHGLMSAHGGPSWKTVPGGSRIYVERLIDRLQSLGARIRCNSPIEAVGRHSRPWVKVAGQPTQTFDHIVMACHSDQSLSMLQDATPDERAILGAVRYRANRAFLHADIRQMPYRKAAWSSWVYKGRAIGDEPCGSFTYWMNNLQSIPSDTPLFVTLNPAGEIPDHLVYDATTFTHPQFDLPAIQAQSRLSAIQGRANTWFCGAWTRYGFHEDGLHSGLAAADALLGADVRTGTVIA